MYKAGEMDWVAYGLPTEGKKTEVLRVSDVMSRDIPTCDLHDQIGRVWSATRNRGWDICVVLNEKRVILGLLHGDAWKAPPDTIVESVMSNGPPTTRPSTFIESMVKRLQQRHTPGILISNPSGVLMGYLWTSDAERALETGNCRQTWKDRDYCPSEVG